MLIFGERHVAKKAAFSFGSAQGDRCLFIIETDHGFFAAHDQGDVMAFWHVEGIEPIEVFVAVIKHDLDSREGHGGLGGVEEGKD